jgi:hypothetical protein
MLKRILFQFWNSFQSHSELWLVVACCFKSCLIRGAIEVPLGEVLCLSRAGAAQTAQGRAEHCGAAEPSRTGVP